LSLLPLNQWFKRGTTVMLQAFRTWQTCTQHQQESPEMEIRLKEISATIEHGRGCPNRLLPVTCRLFQPDTENQGVP